MPQYYTRPDSPYTSSEKAALDILNDAEKDLSPREVSEQCEFNQSTICKALQTLEEMDKATVTREVGHTKLYESTSKRQLRHNLHCADHNGESFVKEYILHTLEYAKQDVTITNMATVSGFTKAQLRRRMNNLVDEGLVERTRKVDGAYLYTLA